MAHLLLIDTTSKLCSVALTQDDKILGLRESDDQLDHAARLTVFIQDLLAQHNLTPQQLSAVAISEGPGSYTGLRIGTSVAKGLCYALDIPLIAVDTLYALASGAREKLDFRPGELIVPVIDSRKEEIYAAIYDQNLKTILAPCPLNLADDPFGEFLQNHDLFFVGHAIQKVQACVHYRTAHSSDEISHSSVNLAPSAYKSYQIKAFKSLIYFEPLYLKDVYVNVRIQ